MKERTYTPTASLCEAINYATPANPTGDERCNEPAAYRITVRGITTLKFSVCETHFKEASKGLMNQACPWSAVPTPQREEECTRPLN